VEGFLPPKAPGPEPDLGPRPEPQAPPAVEAPPGYAPPDYAAPSGHPPAQGHPPAPGYMPQPVEADNGPAVTGFVLSLVAGGLLIVSGGISTIVSVGLSIFGIVYSRRGKRRVQSGQTSRNAGLAQAGFIIGIVSLVLSVLATIAWIAVVVLIATDEQFREDFENEFDDSNTITALRIVGIAGRALLT
jgi:hypothetical protein